MRPRDQVMAYLSAVGEVRDPGGLASTALAEAVSYAGSSVAFAQLLSAMERSGLIEREIRGRRTYRIQLARGARPRSTGRTVYRAAAGQPAAAGVAAAGGQELDPGTRPDGLDYDELARRLLIEVVRRLAVALDGATPSEAGGPRPDREPVEMGQVKTVASLERELASAQSRQRKLQAENTRLRVMLAAAEQSLAEHQHRAPAAEAGARLTALDAGAVQMLERLLSSLSRDAV